MHNNIGILYSSGNAEVNDSCFIENNSKYTFYEENSQYSITVSNCVLDEDVEEKKNEYVMIVNTVSGSFVVSITHLSKGDCRTKKSLCTSCLKNSKQTVDALRFLTFVFLLSFLPSNPSNNAWYNTFFEESKT